MRAAVLIVLVFICVSSTAQKKLALVVAIGTYMPGSDIPPIAALNDVKYIKAVLHRNGFNEQDIDTLENSQGTRKAILAALDMLAKKATAGDIIFVHFSCHGQQIRDQKTVAEGKDEEDGYDEALIPYDVKKPQYYPRVYTGENHLRDDDLGPKLIAIRNRIGKKGSLLVLLDACFSGTATRAMEFTQSRGEPVPFNDPENPLEENIDVPEEDHFFDSLSDSASNMVVISGSGPHQQNFQTEIESGGKKEQVGSLTYAFFKAMSDLPSESDYDQLFNKIRLLIQVQHPGQTPLIEGSSSQLVFSGQYRPKNQTAVLTVVQDDQHRSDTVFKINQGAMDGMAAGTSLSIYRQGNSTPFARGIIRECGPFESYGVSNQRLSNEIVYEAKPEEISYGNIGVSVKIKSLSQDHPQERIVTQVKTLFQPYHFISLSDTADLMLDLTGLKGPALIDMSDSVRWQANTTDSLSTQDLDGLLQSVRTAMRVKYLRTMPDGGDLAKYITVELLPSTSQDSRTGIQLQASEEYSLKLLSIDEEKLFYTVLDITPDNQVSVLYPSASRQPAEYMIGKRSTVIRKLRVSRDTPKGREFLKVIVSKEPMDLRSVLQHSIRRSEMSSFQSAIDDIFSDEMSEQATRGDIASVRTADIGIVSTSFMIK